MASIFDGLNNIPIFEGRSEEDRRRALLQAGLALTEPQDPLAGGNALTQLAGGVSAGLQSLDITEAKNTATEQQAFENIIRGRGATAEEVRAAAAKTTAESTTTVAKTGAGGLAEEISQFDDLDSLRKAEILLKTKTAEWMARRWTGPPGATSKVTTASTNAQVIEAWKQVLLAKDPVKYTGADGQPNEAMLEVDAFGAMHKQSSVADAEQLAFILGRGEAGVISTKISELQGLAPSPGSVSTLPEAAADAVVGGDLPIVVTAEDREKVPIGSDYMHNGVRRTRQ